jgi:hypothetical protein
MENIESFPASEDRFVVPTSEGRTGEDPPQWELRISNYSISEFAKDQATEDSHLEAAFRRRNIAKQKLRPTDCQPKA